MRALHVFVGEELANIRSKIHAKSSCRAVARFVHAACLFALQW